jgi:hypothetical protein
MVPALEPEPLAIDGALPASPMLLAGSKREEAPCAVCSPPCCVAPGSGSFCENSSPFGLIILSNRKSALICVSRIEAVATVAAGTVELLMDQLNKGASDGRAN